MQKQLTFGEALVALMALTAGVGALAFATLSWIEGGGWQTGAFAIGSIYTMSWGWARLLRRI